MSRLYRIVQIDTTFIVPTLAALKTRRSHSSAEGVQTYSAKVCRFTLTNEKRLHRFAPNPGDIYVLHERAGYTTCGERGLG